MATLISVAVGSLLIITGVGKAVMGFDRFSEIIRGYQLLPSGAAQVAARIVPVLEISLGCALAAELGAPFVAVSVVVLLLVFSLAAVTVLLRGVGEIPCGCFGSSKESNVSWMTASRAALLGFAVLSTLWLPRLPLAELEGGATLVNLLLTFLVILSSLLVRAAGNLHRLNKAAGL